MTDPQAKTDSGKQRPETREQRRMRERINNEAQEIIQTLQSRFSDFFLTCENPEGPEVVEKMKVISAQWRAHCKRRNLIPAAYPVLDQYMEDQVKQYYALKENPEKVISETVGN
jgi:hypothetical protein